MRRPTITTRRMMVLVALVAIPLALWREIEARRMHLRTRAAHHRSRIVGGLGVGGGLNGTSRIYLSCKFKSGKFDRSVTTREYFSDMWRLHLLVKYENAEKHLWPLVEPDPPEPNWPENLPAYPQTPPWLTPSLLVAEGLGWDTSLFREARSLIYYVRCERVYRCLIAAGDPNVSYCREQAENHADMMRWSASYLVRRWLSR